MADVSVRPAQSNDVPRIAAIQLLTWRTGYADILPAEVFEHITPERAIIQWQQAVNEPPTARHHVLAACEGPLVVGFVAFGPADDEEVGSHAAGIAIMLVEPRWQRRGHGSRMLAATVDAMQQDDMTTAVVWLPERDTASQNFYLSAGWEPDGTIRLLDAHGQELRELRMHTSLADQNSND